LKISVKVGFKIINLNVNYNSTLIKVGINLVALTNELKSFNFLVLMSLKVSRGKPKPLEARKPFVCILDSLNKFSKVLIDELFNALPLCKEVDHKIETVLKMILLSKAPYRLN
jgi:hypothetical protein